jgi:tail collar domain
MLQTKSIKNMAGCIVLASVTFIPTQFLRAQSTVDLQVQMKELRKELSELRDSFKSFQGANVMLREDLSKASTTILPIGSIVAFSGPTSGLLQTPNWLPCDGQTVSSVQYPVLWDRIKTTWGGADDKHFKLPDLQGLFLRGVDGGKNRDPDSAANARDPTGSGERNTVGTTEADSTRLPNRGFSTTKGEGSHGHDLDLQTNATRLEGPPTLTVMVDKFDHYEATYPPNPAFVKNTVASPWIAGTPKKLAGGGDHTHTLSGGDQETRPKNAAVFWIIRVQ